MCDFVELLEQREGSLPPKYWVSGWELLLWLDY